MSKLTNRCFRGGHGFVLCLFTVCWLWVDLTNASGENSGEPHPPNILFIMIDDLGWMDLACQGNPLVETPNLDRLASQGIRFTDAYSAAAVCSPTRAAVMTGQSPARLKITNHIPDQERFTPNDAVLQSAAMVDHLDLSQPTIAKLLGAAGYATGFIGKWHLAGRGDESFFPEHFGFELNIGGCHLGGPPTFFDPYNIPNIPPRKSGEYLPDRLADESVQFIRDHRDEKFLLFLWPYTVHWPMEAPEDLLRKYESRTGPGLNDTRYGAMIEAMDRAVGRVLNELDRLNLSSQTLVIFTSDNGGYGGVSDCRPLRASKGYLYEGGIRVPLIVRWPGHAKPGSICNMPVVSMDFFPTLLDVAQLTPPHPQTELDGTSLFPLFENAKSSDSEGKLSQRALYFHYPNYAWHKSNRLGGAIRRGKYKLIENYDDGSVELYDLSHDISESTNVAEKRLGIASRMRRELDDWRGRVNANMPARIDN